MNKIEYILPWVTVLKFKFCDLPTISCRYFVCFKLMRYSEYEEDDQIVELVLTCTPYSLAFVRDSCMSL